MTKMLKRDCPTELKLQRIETLMNELGVSIISYGGHGLAVSFQGVNGEFWIQSCESGEKSQRFPRFTEDERLVIKE